MDILKKVKQVEEEVIEWRRHLHQYPETGFDLDETVKFVCERLDEIGIPYEINCGAKNSIVAFIEGKNRDKVIALRADMDALPVKEETGLEFASKNDNMHACGHDAHTSILLGAAKIINEMKDQLNGSVKLIFQPAEELGTGSKGICEAGYLDDVDEVLGLHVGNITEEGKNGELLFAKGSMMACMDKFTIKVIGTGAHGAYPSRSVDPVVISGHIIVGLQEILGREIEPTEPAVITVGSIQGGSAFNIIPGEAIMEGTVRAVNNETREFIAKRIGEIAENIANAYRGTTEYEFFYQPPPVVNDKEVTEKVMESAKKLFKDDVHELENPVMGGEDFAWYLEEAPGTFVFLRNPMKIDGKVWAHHNSRFALDESQFKKGIALFTQYIVDELM